MPFFSIGNFDNERVEITLIGSPADAKTEGYDWISANVEISVGGFTGRAAIYMCLSDMIRFEQELKPVYEKVSGVAEFKTIENQLYFRIEVDAAQQIVGREPR